MDQQLENEQTVVFHLRILDRRAVSDLSSTVLGLSGVAGASISPDGRSVTVQYDSDYTDAKVIGDAIDGSGYKIQQTDGT